MMLNETTEPFGKESFTDRVKGSQGSFLAKVEEKDGIDRAQEVKEIVSILVDIVENTELPYMLSMEMEDTTSSHNDKVRGKMESIARIRGLESLHPVPVSMTYEYPMVFDNRTLKKAPWVNIIHGWGKVLNCLNSISVIQREELETSSNDSVDTPLTIRALLAIAYDLSKLTLKGPEEENRLCSSFMADMKYVETFRRESGELGVNAERKINFSELRWILGVVRESYLKETST